MTNEQKAIIYDDCIRESEQLQRENSKLKSEYSGNPPEHIQVVINQNDRKIQLLVQRLEDLFRFE